MNRITKTLPTPRQSKLGERKEKGGGGFGRLKRSKVGGG